MHMLRVYGVSPKGVRKTSPLAKEIELRREEMIRGILGNTAQLVNQQLKTAQLDPEENGDIVMKATNSLLDRAFGKAKESIDFTGNIQFSLKDLAKKADMLEAENEEIE